MSTVATIGLDVAKDVFQVHGAAANGARMFNRRLRRSEILDFFKQLPPCIVGIEACSTSHHWARSIAEFGHDVRLIHAQYVRAFVKRGKTDANDAEAINEALTSKAMRFVPVKTAEQQVSGMIFRTRAFFVHQRTQAINSLRAHLAELGIVTAKGARNVKTLAAIVEDGELPACSRLALRQFVDHIQLLDSRIAKLNREILAQTREDETRKRLMTIPGVGPITAAAIHAFVPQPREFRSARHFASWVGLTPKSHSSGASQVLGHISKMGNAHLRSLLVVGAMIVLRQVKADDVKMRWLSALKKRRPFKVAAVALANKTARIVWALLVKGGTYVGSPNSTSAVNIA